MGFLDKLKQLLGGGSSGRSSVASDSRGLWFHFRCKRCGSVVAVRADRLNDLNREEGPGTFLLRKDVMDNKCFQLMTAEIWLDENCNVVATEITGGELISREDYEAALAK
jgi:hypothetical protein